MKGGKTLKLLVISHGYPPYYGGAEHVAHFLAREAALTSRYDVTALTSDIGGRLPAEEVIDGVSVIRVSASKKRWERHSVLELARFYCSASRRMEAIIKDLSPNHIIAHFSFPAGKLACSSEIPYSVVLHGSDVPGYQPERFGYIYPFMKPLVRKVWHDASHVVAVSDELRNLALSTWPSGDIGVIENGVDTKAFYPASTDDSEKSEINMIVTAQLIERKGIQYLLTALSKIKTAMEWNLKVCGVGPYEGELRRMAKELGIEKSVDFAGLIEHSKLPDLLRASDIFLMPSLQEGLPLALLEALSSGLAVISTKVGGIPSLLKDRKDAMLVDAGDVSQLESAIEESISDAGLRKTLGKAARNTVEQFSWSHVWARYEELLVHD